MNKFLDFAKHAPTLLGALLLAETFLRGLAITSIRACYHWGSFPATTDLSVYETAGHTPEGNYLVNLWVNQVDHGQQTVSFKKCTRKSSTRTDTGLSQHIGSQY